MFHEGFSARIVIRKIPVENKGALRNVRTLHRVAQFRRSTSARTRFVAPDVFAVHSETLSQLARDSSIVGCKYNSDALFARGAAAFGRFPVVVAKC
jgi:hypothetical protein